MSQFSDEPGVELRELFFESAQELLQSLNEEALKLEKRPGDAETVRTIRRIVHTLKGDAAAVGFREVSDLAHQLEDALALESVASKTALAEVAFTAADTFTALLASIRSKKKAPSADPLRKMVRDLTQQPGAGKGRKKANPASTTMGAKWTEYENLAAQNALNQGKQVYHVSAQVDRNCAMPIAARQLVLNAMNALGEVIGSHPEAGSTQAAKRFEFLLATDEPAELVTAKAQIPTVVSQARVEALGLPRQKSKSAAVSQGVVPRAEEPGRAAATAVVLAVEQPESQTSVTPDVAAPENMLRVEAERIDNVLNLVGELIIGKSMLQQALGEFARNYPQAAMGARFADAMAFQSRVLHDLQRSVMKIRMVPVEQLFRRFPRVVRDVAKLCGKEVNLVLSGQDTDLDKSILDAIAEPLTHLVRNAVGHGIESAQERSLAGKPARGTMRLDAYHQGNQVIVEVSDDGRGIDVQKVKAKAVEVGLLSRDEADRLSETGALDLVFRPGFSTAEEITEVSGRGVGLDVVQSVLHRLKGTVSIETYPGQGTTFRLKLPLTLAIIKALLFRVDQRLYAIPLNAVAEIARARESDLHQVDNYEVLQMRNQVVGMVRLGRRRTEHRESTERIFVLVVHAGERKLGLIVDSLAGEEELVIKALDDQTVATDLVSGASILGDGRVVLILNLAAVVEHFSRSRPGDSGAVYSGLLLPRAERAPGATPAEVHP